MHRCFLQAAIHTPSCELQHSLELNAVVLIADLMRRKTHHDFASPPWCCAQLFSGIQRTL